MKRKSSLKNILWLFLGLAFFMNAQAQEMTVTGNVTDAKDGSPLPGVTVLKKNTTSGTITDVDGNFTLKAATGDIMVFSFIGYESQEVILDQKTSLKISLTSETVDMDEVMVVGYGTTKKKDATGSIKSVSTEDFNKGAIVSPDQLLSGKTAGVQITPNNGEPGGASKIRIRGGTSINASNEPLFVIDGVPVDNSEVKGTRNPLNAIDPNDIESMTVLKDASATAIYGSRGANGVIIITSKKGKAGQKGAVSYNGYKSFGQIAQKPDLMDADEFRSYVEEKAPQRLSELGKANTNWYDELLQTAIGESHSVSFTGGSETIGFRTSVGHMKQEGIIKSSKTERTNLSIGYNQRLFDDMLRIEANVKGAATTDVFSDEGALGSAIGFDPTQAIKDPNSPYGGYFEYENGNAPKNPVALINLKEDEGKNYRSIGNIKADYRLHFLPELKATLNLGYDIMMGSRHRFEPSYMRTQTSDNGTIHNENYFKLNQLLDAYLNYNKDLSSLDSHVDFTAGYSYQKFEREYPTFDAQDLSSNILGGGSTNPASRHKTHFNKYGNRLISYFGRLNYSLKDRYLLTFTFRADGSSRFSPNEQWGYFPSSAFAWQVLEEPFMESARRIFSNLKLRAGYGITGNQEIGDYKYLPTYTYSDSKAQYQFGNGFVTTIRPNAYDPNLKWEETSSLNVGLDYGFLNNRITGTLDAYYKETTDLLMEVGVAAGSALSNKVLTNIGSVENKGIEFAIDAEAVSAKDFSWNLGFNVAYNQNKITSLNTVNDPNFKGYPTGGIDGGTGNMIQILRVGESVGTFYVYKHKLDKDGNPLCDLVDHNDDGQVNDADMYEDINGDGTVNDNDKRPYKKSSPDFLMGFSSQMNYKNFDFTFNFRGNIGNYAYNNTLANGISYNRITNNDFLGNVLTESKTLNFKEPQRFSDYFIEDASFVRLDNVTLGYTLKPFKGKVNLRLYGTAQNLFTLTNYKGLDPEMDNGIDNKIYPRSRTFIFGVNINL